MEHLKLSTELLSTLNKKIQSFTQEDTENIQQIIKRIEEVQQTISSSDSKNFINHQNALIDSIICKMNNCRQIVDRPVRIYKNQQLVAVVGSNTPKVNLLPVNRVSDISCTHVHDQSNIFPEPSCLTPTLVDSLESLEQLSLSQPFLIEIKHHSYRTYSPFVCLILITTNTHSYVIDTLKLRQHLPNSKIFSCPTFKIFHCSECFHLLSADLKVDIGCFKILKNFYFPKIAVDWRIRPLSSEILKIIEKENQHFFTQLRISQEDLYDEEFIDKESSLITKFDVRDEDRELLENLLKLRTHIAKNNNESEEYVMTDKQIVNILVKKPSTREEFLECLGRMSPVVRAHCSDFVLLICEKKEKFSVERLKTEHVEMVEEEVIEEVVEEVVEEEVVIPEAEGKQNKFMKMSLDVEKVEVKVENKKAKKKWTKKRRTKKKEEKKFDFKNLQHTLD